MSKEIAQFTLDEYKKYLSAYPIFGELEVVVTETDDGYGYKIEVKDLEVCEYIDEDGNKNVEDMKCNIVTMFTDKEGIIGCIEHGFGVFTRANKDLVIHTANFIGKKILDLEQHTPKRRLSKSIIIV